MSKTFQSLCTTAEDYLARGWLVVPVPFKEKAPLLKGWQALRLVSIEKIRAAFNGKPQNLGVLLGEPSDRFVDLDTPDCLPIVRALLPSTLTFGRKSNPSSHWLYYADPVPRTTAYQFRNEKIIEQRGTGGQTIFPPSLHPRGESIEWQTKREIPGLALPKLQKMVSAVAAGALLARAWPRVPSNRDECVMALAGGLLREGWTADKATLHPGCLQCRKRTYAELRGRETVYVGNENDLRRKA
jgi:putative DNA primase/helicase